MQKFWALLFGAVLLAELVLYCVAPVQGWWMPKDVSTYGYEVDLLLYVILGITGFFFVLTSAILVYNLYRFVGQPGKKSQFVHGSHKLEVLWTIVPAIILIVIAVVQVQAWERIKYQLRMPDPNQLVVLNARQFEWRFRYPDPKEAEIWLENWNKPLPRSEKKGQQFAVEWAEKPQANDIHVVNQLHVWKAKEKDGNWAEANVKIYLQTKDVIHSFFLPNLRLKQDALPGKTIPAWFQAKEANTHKSGDGWVDGMRYDESKQEWVPDKDNIWELACAELCGRDHTKMRGRIYVHETKEDFLAWLQDAQAKQSSHVGTPEK